jgi:Uma2 family endonuclease
MAVTLLRRRFTVEDYYRMADAGILTEDDRVELLDGEVVDTTPIGSRHAACVGRLNRLLTGALGDRAIVRVQNPIRLDRRSEPQPDLAVLRCRDDFYAAGHPEPADVFLVIEVAETSVDTDRAVKVPLYARAGVPAVWLVILPQSRVVSYRTPAGDHYGHTGEFARGQRIHVEEWPDVSLAVDDVLGPP